MILSLTSQFFKELFESTTVPCQLKIILPEFSSEVVTPFLRFFFYTGEILIENSLLPDVISLLRQFNCEQQIPILNKLDQSYKSQKEMESAGQEWFEGEKSGDLSITRVSAKVEEMEFDEYFETNDNVEQIFFTENDSEADYVAVSKNSEKHIIKEEADEGAIDPEYLNEEYIDENQQNDDQKTELQCIDEGKNDEHSQSKTEVSDPIFLENLQSAVEDVRKNGLSFWDAYKKYGIPRNLVYKHVQRLNKKEKSSAPSISFPANCLNINQLREEQNRFKKRLQEAINSCRDSNNSVKKAAKLFGVPEMAIERNLRGFKGPNP